MSDQTGHTPLRSVLYMPSSNAKALEKAKTLPVDGVILDLEDAVAPDAKPAAREAAAAAVASGDYGRRTLTIRVNAVGTEWHDDDLRAACQAGPAAVVVPKVGSAAEVHDLVRAMQAAGAPDHTRLWAMVETPRAILDALAIAEADERLSTLVLGTNDLVKELYAEHVPGRAPILPSLHTVVLAARAAGIAVLDGVYNDVKDTEGFLAECTQGRQLGFDGKTLIHPGQVEGANQAFAPSPEAVDDARGVLEAWESGQGAGVVTYRGRMVENLHVESARRTEVYDAVLERFGADRVAAVAMTDTYRVRHAVRDVGAALGMPPGEVDAIAKAFPHLRARDVRAALRDLPELRASGLADARLDLLYDLVEGLDGLPRHTALHPCGVLLSDATLLDRTPVQPSATVRYFLPSCA